MSTAASVLRKVTAFDFSEVVVVALGVIIVWQLPGYLLIIPVGLVSLSAERLRPVRRGQPIRRLGWRTDLYHAVVSHAGAAIITAIVSVLLLRLRSVSLSWLSFFGHQPVAAQTVEALLLADFLVYWVHRLDHTLPLLWRFHAVHHSSEEMDWASGFRAHPVDIALTSLAALLPFTLLQTPWALGIFGAFDLINSAWAHSNFDVNLGRFWWVIRNPQLHRWHHAKERRPGNSNFALMFPIWDVIFHTTCFPRDRVVKNLGIPGGMSSNYLEQIMGPFRPKPRREAGAPSKPVA